MIGDQEELRPGDRVRVRSGPYREFTGTVRQIDPARGQAMIRMKFFGRYEIAEVEIKLLERLQDS
jgi:transcription antitermination factor NusG